VLAALLLISVQGSRRAVPHLHTRFATVGGMPGSWDQVILAARTFASNIVAERESSTVRVQCIGGWSLAQLQ